MNKGNKVDIDPTKLLQYHPCQLCMAVIVNTIFQGDNARPHNARIVTEILRQQGVEQMEGPAFLSDLNQIEHAWDEHTSSRTILIEDVFLMIRRKKVTVFTDAKETTSLGEVKKIIEGICKVCPENQKLFKDDQPLTDDHKTLGDYGFTGATARAQAPATLGLAFRQDDGEWESLEISSYSSPPELPDVMKPQDSSSSHAQEQSAS